MVIFKKKIWNICKKETDEFKDSSYSSRLLEAVNNLEKNSSKYLNKEALKLYSPKFLNILENIEDEQQFGGINMLYSQFKTLEGIGIFKLVLKEHGFLELKIKRLSATQFELDINETEIQRAIELRGKVQFFASYTGSEKPEEREVILNILNSNWKIVPQNIIDKIKKYNPSIENNNNGEVVKLLMISSSGAEGISLKNVRYVHIMEPYWHPVRIQQVIGRARRICSHSDLPKEYQDVHVILYLMTFTDEQVNSDSAIELRLKDKSKLNQKLVLSSDEFLYEISNIKEKINIDILRNIKESAIDCSIHSRSSSSEKIKCFSIGNALHENPMYIPNINYEEKDKDLKINQKEVPLKLFKIRNQNLALDKDTNDVYDYDAYKKGELLFLGKFIQNEDGKYELVQN
jgi:hypothetical protein